LDHYNPSSHEKFQQRFLLNDDYFGQGKDKLFATCPGPIFLYTGNEGDITDFWAANGE